MYKKATKICIILLSILIAFFMFSESGVILASQTSASVSIKFFGDEAKRAGFAQSEITVVPPQNGAQKGYYVIYYTDGKQVLSDYDEVTAIKITGDIVKGVIRDGIMLPRDAKGIAVFESSTYYMSKTPNIKDAIATAAIPSSKQTPDFGPVQFSFGALSDTHINYQSYNRGAYEKLRNSLDFFARKKMDIVVIAGDITGDRGESPDLEAQYQKHVEIVNASNFSSSKVFEAIGNHGNTPSDSRLLNAYLGSSEEKHPFKGSPYYHVLVDGNAGENDNLFIFMAHEIEASSDVATKDNFSAGQINWLENLLSRYDNGNTNIFVVLHSPFLNYGAGDIENGSYKNCIKFDGEFTQTMRLFSLLEEHKDAIVMSGHTHVSFYENANYSDENNQFARTVHIGSNCQPCAYGNQSTLVRNFDGRRNVTADYGSEGYTVEVYSDFIVYSGYNLSTGKKIPAACLLIPVKAYGEPEDNDFILENSGDEINDDNPNADDKPTNFPTPDTEGSPSATPQNQTEGGVNTPASANGSLLHIDDEKKSNGIWIWILVLGIIIVPPIIVVIVLLIVRKK